MEGRFYSLGVVVPLPVWLNVEDLPSLSLKPMTDTTPYNRRIGDHARIETRVKAILNLLGPDATERDARSIEPALAQAFPGVPIAHLPPETFSWLKDGSGKAPVVVVVPASATSLLGIYADMSDPKRAQLLAVATVISKDY